MRTMLHVLNYANGTDFVEDFKEFSTSNATQLDNTNQQAQIQMKTGLDAFCTNDTLDTAIYEYIEHVSFWIEGVAQFAIGIFGITTNLLMIPILSSHSMKSIFNRLLTCLLIIHTIYIITTLTIYLGHTKWAEDRWFNILFVYALHPLRPLMLYSSSFITVLMARQRFLAIRHPVQYRNANLGTNPWIPAIQCLVIITVATTIFISPLWFETSITDVGVSRVVNINTTHFQYVSKYKVN